MVRNQYYTIRKANVFILLSKKEAVSEILNIGMYNTDHNTITNDILNQDMNICAGEFPAFQLLIPT